MYRLCTNIVVCFQLSHLNDDLTFLLLAVLLHIDISYLLLDLHFLLTVHDLKHHFTL
jgi:hypothetical protein